MSSGKIIDWRERDWQVGDTVQITTRAGGRYVGEIVALEFTLGCPMHGWFKLAGCRGVGYTATFERSAIRDMVRLVPEPHKVGDHDAPGKAADQDVAFKIGDQAELTFADGSTLRGFVQVVDRHGQLIALGDKPCTVRRIAFESSVGPTKQATTQEPDRDRCDELQAAEDWTRSGAKPDLFARVRAIEEHLDVSTALAARVTKLEQAVGNHAGWVQPELHRRVEALDRQNEQGTRLAGHESQIATLFARVQVAEKRLEDQSLLIRAMIYDGSTKPAACPTCTAPAEHVAALAKAVTREQPKPVAEPKQEPRKHKWLLSGSPLEGYPAKAECCVCGYTVDVPGEETRMGRACFYSDANSGPCTCKEQTP